MKQESQVSRIYQAFTEDSDLPKEIVDSRLEICNSCEFNTRNTPSENLSLLQKQKKVLGDFCTQCGCFISKKTARASEACGLEGTGVEPKWFRVKLVTQGNNHLNLKNIFPDNTNISVSEDGERFIITTKPIARGSIAIAGIEILNEDVIVQNIKAYCGCTTTQNSTKSQYLINVDTSSFGDSPTFRKTVLIEYFINNSSVLNSVEVTVTGQLI